jgi:hypothetical protein
VPLGSRDVPGEHIDLSWPGPVAPRDRYEVKIASWEALLGETLSFDTVLERIAQLPFEATMLSLSALAGALYHARYDTDLHWRLACDVLIDGPVLEAVRRFLAGGPGRIVFDPRYLTVFQRLLVEHSRTDGDSLDDEQARIVIACLLALPDALPKTSASDSNKIMHAARVDPTPHEVHETLTKLLIGKLDQLQKRIAELLEGLFTPPGVCDVETVKVWPVLLLAGEGIALTPTLWRWVEMFLPEGSFSDPRVGPPTVCSLDEFERLLVLIERGESLPKLLASFHASGYSRLPILNWIADTYTIEADEIATYVEEQYMAITSRWRESLEARRASAA